MSQIQIQDDCVRLSGELTFATTPDLYEQMEQAQNGNAMPSVIDLSEITATDSSGLALLLEWQASRGQEDDQLRIENAPANLLRLARMCEAEEFLQISARENGD